GAGTVEFVVDGDECFFLELNGRIQVEHPVTEAVTSIDLVERQIRIAEGDVAAPSPIPASHGHAVEARLYAEDPRTFLPSAGRIERFAFGPGIRIDSAVEEGDEIGLAYDPMIAKLIAHGRDREEALGLLASALAETHVDGVTTNLPFLRWLVAHPVIRAGEATTAFLAEHPPLSQPPLVEPAAPFRTPWPPHLPAPPPPSPPDIEVESHRPAAHGESTVVAPMPGTVIRVEVAAGDRVRARQAVVVLEAMKMEVPVHSPFDAEVKAVHVSTGDRV